MNAVNFIRNDYDGKNEQLKPYEKSVVGLEAEEY